MTTKQKIWLAVFLGMFLVPEILWSPVGNIIYSLFAETVNGYVKILRTNFLIGNNFENLYKIVLLLQLVGIFSSIIFVLRQRKKIKQILFWFSLIIFLLIFFLNLFGFYLIAFFKISF